MIGLFPILSLYAHNVYETSPRSLVLPMGLTLVTTLAIWLGLKRLSRNWQRAALATSLLVALFFGFNDCRRATGAILERLSHYWVRQDVQVHPLLMLILLSLAAIPAMCVIFRWMKNPELWSGYLNVFSLILIALPLSDVALAWIREPVAPIIRREGGVSLAAPPARLPDIYFIVLDAYARSDVLSDLFGYNNDAFLRRLEEKGFYVARKSRSNYCQTTLSLGSTLNCEYLDRLVAPNLLDREPLSELIRDNLVVRSLRPLGYKFVAFGSGYDPTECPEADRYLNPRHPANNFQMLLIGMTPLNSLPIKIERWDFYAMLRKRILFILDQLPEVVEEQEPTFTFAHLIAPHHPFLFGENGEDLSPREGSGSRTTATNYREGYRKQAIYLTKRIEQMINQILARSPEPPIIILQSDHGSGLRHHLNDLDKTDLRERMSILNCCYFPNHDYRGLNEAMTAVNTFRFTLNSVFGANLPVLEDKSYFSTYDDPLKFEDVTEILDSDRDLGREYTLPDHYPGMVH